MFSGSTVRLVFRRWLRMFLAVHTKPPMCQLMDGIVRWWAKWDVEYGVDPPRSSDNREYAVLVCVGVWLEIHCHYRPPYFAKLNCFLSWNANVLAYSAGHFDWKQNFADTITLQRTTPPLQRANPTKAEFNC
ncbi:hypothetical protein BCR44DRAFT_1260866 [Catenaria anguillulae PL171]|uniref:Uncharacterized protein n=1 Tax=Catenaria anguillulae PL171 TaxID=765915 RepID=A0A1Y2HBA8_9FUNG|nr:hypothetical protein BCR44DRAFT_1260866 [Catenaria anguillulae PL171]